MTLADIKNEAQSLITTDNVPESLEFAQKLENSLVDNNVKTTNPNAYKELSKIIFQLYIASIPNISTELFFKIISLNLIEALQPIWQSPRSLAELIESRYSIYPIEMIKEMMRQDIMPYIKQNQQLIGTALLRLSQEKPQEKPSIANWLEYYDRVTGLGITDNFARSRFMSSDPIVQTLLPPEKESLRKIIQFYDYLQTDDTILYQDIMQSSYSVNSTPSSSQSIINNSPIKTQISVPSTFTEEILTNDISSQQSIPVPQTMEHHPEPIAQNTIPQRYPIPKKSSPPIVLTAKPTPIPKNLVNLKKPE